MTSHLGYFSEFVFLYINLQWYNGIKKEGFKINTMGCNNG